MAICDCPAAHRTPAVFGFLQGSSACHNDQQAVQRVGRGTNRRGRRRSWAAFHLVPAVRSERSCFDRDYAAEGVRGQHVVAHKIQTTVRSFSALGRGGPRWEDHRQKELTILRGGALLVCVRASLQNRCVSLCACCRCTPRRYYLGNEAIISAPLRVVVVTSSCCWCFRSGNYAAAAAAAGRRILHYYYDRRVPCVGRRPFSG